MTQPPSEDGDRRSSTRRACILQVRYRGQAGGWHPATAVDLSTTGCRLRVGEDLPGGASLRVAFTGPPADGAQGPEVEASGTVMWCRLEGLSHQAGVHFSEERSELQRLLD
jgi:hypothetical protein